MSDFYQTGVVATFHRLGRLNLEKIEAELTWYSQEIFSRVLSAVRLIGSPDGSESARIR